MRLTLETAALGHGVALARTSYPEDLLRTRQLRRLFDVRMLASDNLYLALARGTAADRRPRCFGTGSSALPPDSGLRQASAVDL